MKTDIRCLVYTIEMKISRNENFTSNKLPYIHMIILWSLKIMLLKPADNGNLITWML